jgi:DNA-directed RNA polymerase specialized sigma24 family protein
MPSSGSVTHWIRQIKAGDSAPAQLLWQRYWHRLVTLARRKLRQSRRRAADEEDVALSAFDSFCRGAAQGRFPLLSDRNNLWGLLIVLTSRKAADQIEHERRLKRGGGAVRGESALAPRGGSAGERAGLDQLTGRQPAAAFAAQAAEECERLLGLLKAELRPIALWKLEGYTNPEIAAKLGCVVSTVERKLRMIRHAWQRELDS